MDIPQDIIDSVIAAVGDDKCVLKKCTLVSSSFLLPSRKQLFSKVYLRSDQTCQGIHQFLVRNPVIQSAVRAITLIDDFDTGILPNWINGPSLLAILRLPFCCLERFSIIERKNSFCAPNFWHWKSFSSELRDALSNIIRSSTLKSLCLTGILEVPVTFFLHIVHLTTLVMRSIQPIDFYVRNSSSLTRAASKGMAPMASHAVIDRCVWHFEDYMQEHTQYEVPFICLFLINSGQRRFYTTTEPIFLPFMCRIRSLKIDIGLGFSPTYNYTILSFVIRSLCINLTSPATLEHLELSIQFDDFLYSTFYEDLRGADVWSHLDSINTHPIGSRLQRVDVNINYRNYCYDDFDEDKIAKAVLDGLPLLRTKGILFVEVHLPVGRCQ